MDTLTLFALTGSLRRFCVVAASALLSASLVLADAPVLCAAIIPINVPNGGFEIIQKPGTGGTVTGILHNVGGTNFTYAQDFGTNVTIGNGGGNSPDPHAIAWSDGSFASLTDKVDVPGWTREASGNIGIQPASPHSGFNELGINGSGFGNSGNALTFVSAASLGTISAGVSYTLQAYAGGVFNNDPAASSIVLDLLANGTALTPTSSISPTTDGSYQLYSRSYSAADIAAALAIGDQLTIRIGIPNGATGDQTNFDDVTLSLTTPEPATATLLVVGAVALLGSRAHRFGRRRPVGV